MTRSALREQVFKLLYRVIFNNEEEMKRQEEMPLDLPEDADEGDARFIREHYREIAARLGEIDKILNDVTTGWRTERMNTVDLTILRLATYEIMWDERVPDKAAINEAVELAKKYSGGQSPSFVNGVLAKVEDLRTKSECCMP